MNTTPVRSIIVTLFVILSTTSIAQDSESEDIFELSPFSIVAGGYSTQSSLAGTRVQTNLIDNAAAIDVVTSEFLRDLPYSNPTTPVILIKPADALSIQFAISFYDDMEQIRKETLENYLVKIQTLVESQNGLRFEPGALEIAQGDRKKSIRKRKSEYTSHAHITIFAELAEDIAAFETVRNTRKLLEQLKIESEVTKLFDGPVNLVLKNPDQFRPELLSAIFDDLNVLKKGLGDAFEVIPSGLNGRVQARPHSNNEVELWIQYDLKIRSVREFEFAKAKLLLSLNK